MTGPIADVSRDEVLRRRLDALLRRVGSALAKGQAGRARALSEAFLTRSPASPEGLFALALAAALDGDYALAAASVAGAGEAAPDVREIADLAAVIHGRAGDLNTAVYFGKLATTLTSDPRLAAIVPASLPPLARVLCEIEAHPFVDRAGRASAGGDWARAEHWYRQHLAFHPDAADVHVRLAITLLKQGRARAAADVLRAARHRLPDDVEIATVLGKALAGLGRFAEAHACHRWATARAPGDAATAAAAVVDQLLDPASPPDALAPQTRAWGAAFGMSDPSQSVPPRSARSLRVDGPRLTIGLLVAGEATATAAMGLARILMHRDAARFRIVGFGFGSLAEPANVPFQKAVEHWCDIADGDPLTLAAMAEAERIDILVDLAGFAAPHLLPAFGRRMAPCQVAWTNAPYGTGLAAMDILLTDAFVDPDPAGAGRYRETLAYLDLGCVTALPDVAPAATAGGPAGGRPGGRTRGELIFAADATFADLDPATIACWAEIMHRVPGTKLLLRNHDFREPEAVGELIASFGTFGISHRIDVVDAPSAEALFAAADIALLPLAYPQVESVVSALAVGVPLVCPAGEGRHRRLAASVLHHLGLGAETIASSFDAGIERALDWAGAPERRRAFRRILARRRARWPAADPRARARDLEAVWEKLWRQTCAAGEAQSLAESHRETDVRRVA